MQVPLQIAVRDMPHSEALDFHIREKAQKLEQFFPTIISCRVVVERAHKHQKQGNEFNVRIDLNVPGKKEIIVNRDHHEDPYVALRDAFNAAKRQLEDHSRRIQRETKSHSPEYVGRVQRISPEEGYGFIAGPDGTERYFHRDNVVSPPFEHLKEGDEVKFIEEIGDEGPQAKKVSVGRHHVPH